MNQPGQHFIDHAIWRLKEDYFHRLKSCVDQLSEEEVWQRPNQSSNSVGNIILHLCGNVRQWVVHGLGGNPDIRQRQQEFDERGPIPKADLIQKMEFTLNEVEEVLRAFPPDKLMEPVTIQGFDETCLTAIFHVVEHFSYHLGQIAYITKANRDTDLKFFDV